MLCAALTMIGSANAAVLLTDNFNTDGGRPPGGVPGGTASFNDYLSSDQGGTLATITYSGSSNHGGAVGGFYYSIHGYQWRSVSGRG